MHYKLSLSFGRRDNLFKRQFGKDSIHKDLDLGDGQEPCLQHGEDHHEGVESEPQQRGLAQVQRPRG